MLQAFVCAANFTPGATASVAYQILIMFEDPNQNEVGTLFVPIEPGDNTLTLQLKLETALLETYGITSAITVIL
jgi:hypothetical protein